MFKNWLFRGALFAASLAVVSCASVVKNRPSPPFKKTINPFTTALVKFETPLPFSEVLSRLDLAINKTGSANFDVDFHAATTKEEQTSLIADVLQGRNLLWFIQTDFAKWLDVYDPSVKHPQTMVYVIGNPNFASDILPIDYSTGVNIAPRVIILENPDGSGTTVEYHQMSTIFAPFNNNPALKNHTEFLDQTFSDLITGVMKGEMV